MRLWIHVGLVILALPGRVHAQSISTAARIAEQRFNEGLRLGDQNRWDEACVEFAESLRCKESLSAHFNLAYCRDRGGKLATAWELYRKVIPLLEKAGDVKRKRDAEARVVVLEPKLAKLTIFGPANAPTGLLVSRDGARVDDERMGAIVYVDAGEHKITAVAPGFAPFATAVTLIDGQSEVVTLPELTAVPVATREGLPDATIVLPVPQSTVATKNFVHSGSTSGTDALSVAVTSGRRLQTTGIGLTVSGAALLAVGGLFTWFSENNEASFDATEKLVLWGTGATSIAIGLLVYSVGRSRVDDAKVSLTPAPVRGGAAALATWQW